MEKCDADAQKAKGAGVDEMLLCPGQVGPHDALQFLTVTRRAALKRTYRPLGYPDARPRLVAGPRPDEPGGAPVDVSGYAGIIVMDRSPRSICSPCWSPARNVYQDPQVPAQVEAKVYEVNNPDDKSPLFITTNFSLSYYSVLSEVEASRVPARILAVDTKGTSVLTAWAADEFGAEQIAAAIRKWGVLDKLAEGYRKPILPGLVAVLSGELSEELGQQVIVGPKEASGIQRFVKHEWPNLVG